MAGIHPSLRQVVGVVGHLAAWTNHHMAAAPERSRLPARLTYYRSAGTAGYSAGQIHADPLG
jgi:hypothetical protein